MNLQVGNRSNYVKWLQTLNLWTSCIVAARPSETQEWKKDGATDTPRASAVIPVPALSAFEAITRKVPNNKTNSLWV